MRSATAAGQKKDSGMHAHPFDSWLPCTFPLQLHLGHACEPWTTTCLDGELLNLAAHHRNYEHTGGCSCISFVAPNYYCFNMVHPSQHNTFLFQRTSRGRVYSNYSGEFCPVQRYGIQHNTPETQRHLLQRSSRGVPTVSSTPAIFLTWASYVI